MKTCPERKTKSTSTSRQEAPLKKNIRMEKVVGLESAQKAWSLGRCLFADAEQQFLALGRKTAAGTKKGERYLFGRGRKGANRAYVRGTVKKSIAMAIKGTYLSEGQGDYPTKLGFLNRCKRRGKYYFGVKTTEQDKGPNVTRNLARPEKKPGKNGTRPPFQQKHKNTKQSKQKKERLKTRKPEPILTTQATLSDGTDKKIGTYKSKRGPEGLSKRGLRTSRTLARANAL